MRCVYVLTTVLALLGWQWASSREYLSDDLNELAKQAVSNGGAGSEEAIAALRARGPMGLDALFTVHAAAIRHATTEPLQPKENLGPEWQKVRHALDEVSGQRDCHAAHLFWYTDLAQAQAVARLEGKPILSLRLLGKLTDEYSCANSRFFRSTLYANQEVALMLRERFVLHWQSVRPAPMVTIDFGDGRKLLRTVTGNSAHYVLSADGQPLDALPGLYGPKAFMECLQRAETLAQAVMADGADAAALLSEFHGRRSAELQQAWQRDLERLGQTQTGDTPNAPEDVNDPLWERVAVLHAEEAQIDGASQALIRSHYPSAAQAGLIALPKNKVEKPVVRALRDLHAPYSSDTIYDLQSTIAVDSVRNEYFLHQQIHQWFASGQVSELESFNERVYAELFLTPSSDPWLGLLPSSYSGLENGGIVASQR